MNPSWQDVAGEFEPDGALRDIYVSPATVADWQQVMDFIREQGSDLRYSLDDQAALLPKLVCESFSAWKHASPQLTFRFGDIHFATHFFSEDELEFDFSPSDLRGQSDLDTLLGFIQQVGAVLSKPVSVTPENYREGPFLIYDPETRGFRPTPPTR